MFNQQRYNEVMSDTACRIDYLNDVAEYGEAVANAMWAITEDDDIIPDVISIDGSRYAN